MKLAAELAIAGAVFGVSLWLFRSQPFSKRPPDAPSTPPSRARDVVEGGETIANSAQSAPSRRPAPGAHAPAAHHDPLARRELAVLRNAAIEAVARDMHERGTDLVHCLAGADLAGANVLRLGAQIEATPERATIARWRFIEIIDGEPLPDSFATCAAHSLGGPQTLMPPASSRFPAFAGELDVVYRLTAPSE